MRIRKAFLGLLIPAAIVACSDNPVSVDHDDEDDSLLVTLEWSSDHVHTLSEMSFTVTVTDHHGEPVTDHEAVMVQYRLEGDTDWRNIELALSGVAWRAPFTFVTSGEYELRVMGQRHGASEVLYDEHTHLEVNRAHVNVGPYRIEFETFPGHLHEGQMGDLRFWVLERDPDASGVRQPVPGLHAEIHCEEAAGFGEMHEADEHEPGVYEAHHMFMEPGEFHTAIHAHVQDGDDLEAEFHTHVAHAH